MDKIDVFLLKEFGIMGGCCSATKSLEYNVARRVAERLWMGVVISEDLEKAAKEYKDDNPFAGYSVENDYCAGAKWNEQQMMKKAISGRIDSVSNNSSRLHITAQSSTPLTLKPLDRCKVIIIKED